MGIAEPGDKLEAYRDCHLVGESGMQSRLFSGDILPFLFHDSANTAFCMAVDALKAMQDSSVIGPTFPERKPTNPVIVHRLLAEACTRRPIDPTIFNVPDHTAKARSTGNGKNVGAP